MKILHAPSNPANQAWWMAQGLRTLGHEAQVWQYGANAFDFEADRLIEVDDDPRTYMTLLREAVEEDFDVVHFHFARTLVPARSKLPWYWDLPVWRALGKRIVFTFHGSDVRLRSHHLEDDEWSYYLFSDVPCDEERIASELVVLRAYADAMTVGSVLDLPYVPGATYLPKPIDISKIDFVGQGSNEQPVILHAPSRRSTKGTEFILEAFDQLDRRDVEFEVDLVEGVPHAELIERCARADIVVEKVLGGDVGVTSLEAMAMGKVAVTRIRPTVAEAHPDLPVVSADPTTVADVLESLLRDRDRRERLGRAGRTYVETHHDCSAVATRLVELYTGKPRSLPAMTPGWTTPGAHQALEALQDRSERLIVRNHELRRKVREQRTAIKSQTRRPSRRSVALRRLKRLVRTGLQAIRPQDPRSPARR